MQQQPKMMPRVPFLSIDNKMNETEREKVIGFGLHIKQI
jgi:hypothetical protein